MSPPLRILHAKAPVPPPGNSPVWEARFDALMRGHYAALCTFVQRLLGSAEVAEDVVQDVFVAIWQRGLPTECEANPRPYLFRAARNGAISQVRRERTRERWRAEAGRATSDANDSAAARLEVEELDAAIARAVDALPARCRMVFTLHRQHGLTYAEIAEVMGISRKTVENQMSRALAVLRQRLAPYLGVGLLIIARVLQRPGLG